GREAAIPFSAVQKIRLRYRGGGRVWPGRNAHGRGGAAEPECDAPAAVAVPGPDHAAANAPAAVRRDAGEPAARAGAWPGAGGGGGVGGGKRGGGRREPASNGSCW